MSHLAGLIYLVYRRIRSNSWVFIFKAREEARLQPTPATQQEGFSEAELVIQVIWLGLSDLRGAGQSAQRRLDADMLRGQLPAIKPLWLLWLQPVKVCTKTENGNRPRKIKG
ncbi:hypothetical protein FOXB_04584 [Fusarium oxysporum f. sp. conglutinans Fo5176]|uniref:Uncharacterized protein n=1 Tax=Fusarium oxysporum (strain Fo5176) TaxID=660025 RepID=F9FDV6_FUSOF|nr:hypothetical protein FOXB_04584 [Fusarium oxysporum f. sp. conglutinans Fo5176]